MFLDGMIRKPSGLPSPGFPWTVPLIANLRHALRPGVDRDRAMGVVLGDAGQLAGT